ncbi:MAG: TMEM43 family protein [Dokdonella sp.]|uniref:TMEM43 family protein n=1 Tax=Dokdonella sp. TaxID=2291710 RepID=UPI003F7CE333
MARRGRRSGKGRALLLVAIGVLLAGAAAWWLRHHRHAIPTFPLADEPASPGIERIDARNEGREIELSGAVRVARPARDSALAIEADAVMLLRDVQMVQWQEHCAGSDCRYALEWSARRIDSHAFRDAAGHRNDVPFPLSSESFAAAEVRIGAYALDANLAAAGVAAQPYAVSTARLPPNLAATFHDCDGALCTGDPKKPAAGDLRVAYRIVPAGTRRVSGVQHDGRLRAARR